MSETYSNRARFFFNDTATTEIYTLSLHDALPISPGLTRHYPPCDNGRLRRRGTSDVAVRSAVGSGVDRSDDQSTLYELRDRKSTRLNSSHANISYAVFCLKKTNDTPSFN